MSASGSLKRTPLRTALKASLRFLQRRRSSDTGERLPDRQLHSAAKVLMELLERPAEVLPPGWQRPGLEEPGLYREVGRADLVEAVANAAIKDGSRGVLSLVAREGVGPHEVACSLKALLRERYAPLTTYELYEEFLAASTAAQLKALLQRLRHTSPSGHDILNRLVVHFQRLQKSPGTRMTKENIGICIGPTLFRRADPMEDLHAAAEEAKRQSAAVVRVLAHAREIFSPSSVNHVMFAPDVDDDEARADKIRADEIPADEVGADNVRADRAQDNEEAGVVLIRLPKKKVERGGLALPGLEAVRREAESFGSVVDVVHELNSRSVVVVTFRELTSAQELLEAHVNGDLKVEGVRPKEVSIDQQILIEEQDTVAQEEEKKEQIPYVAPVKKEASWDSPGRNSSRSEFEEKKFEVFRSSSPLPNIPLESEVGSQNPEAEIAKLENELVVAQALALSVTKQRDSLTQQLRQSREETRACRQRLHTAQKHSAELQGRLAAMEQSYHDVGQNLKLAEAKATAYKERIDRTAESRERVAELEESYRSVLQQLRLAEEEAATYKQREKNWHDSQRMSDTQRSLREELSSESIHKRKVDGENLEDASRVKLLLSQHEARKQQERPVKSADSRNSQNAEYREKPQLSFGRRSSRERVRSERMTGSEILEIAAKYQDLLTVRLQEQRRITEDAMEGMRQSLGRSFIVGGTQMPQIYGNSHLAISTRYSNRPHTVMSSW